MTLATTLDPLSRRLRNATERTDLDHADIADLLGSTPRTVSRWLNEASEPRPDARRRLLEVVAALEHLSGVLEPATAHDWLFSPNPMLDHHKPADLLADGEFRPVLGLIDALAEGVFV